MSLGLKLGLGLTNTNNAGSEPPAGNADFDSTDFDSTDFDTTA